MLKAEERIPRDLIAGLSEVEVSRFLRRRRHGCAVSVRAPRPVEEAPVRDESVDEIFLFAKSNIELQDFCKAAENFSEKVVSCMDTGPKVWLSKHSETPNAVYYEQNFIQVLF